LQGIGSRSSRKPVNYKLSDVQEVTLFNWVLTLDEIGVGLRLDQLSNAANSILKQDYTGDGEPPVVSAEWPRRFIERQPDLHKMRQKPIELVRKLAHDPEVILSWFQRFQALCTQFGVCNEDIWNFDETGFRIGVGKSQWIVTTSTSKRSYLASDNSRDLVTSVEAVSAGGAVIEEMLILPGKTHLERFYTDLGDNVLVGLSDTGYTNDELSYQYIIHFDRQSKKTQRGAHRILLCDGCGSHITREILEFCEQRLIHMFVLPPHTSHILQPLDVVLFQPLKHFHAKAVDNATRTGCSDFNKLEFLAAIHGIRQQTFKKNSILSSFRECGIVPYNPQIAIDKVQEYLSPPDLTRPSTPLNALLKAPMTPWTDQALERSADVLRMATPSLKEVLGDKFIQGALIQEKCAI
jgi:DDE superfamily endonuclease/Tc5 transposase DNA-binding domain